MVLFTIRAMNSLECCDTVGFVSGRAFSLQKPTPVISSGSILGDNWT